MCGLADISDHQAYVLCLVKKILCSYGIFVGLSIVVEWLYAFCTTVVNAEFCEEIPTWGRAVSEVGDQLLVSGIGHKVILVDVSCLKGVRRSKSQIVKLAE